jgi:hypothetical protein
MIVLSLSIKIHNKAPSNLYFDIPLHHKMAQMLIAPVVESQVTSVFQTKSTGDFKCNDLDWLVDYWYWYGLSIFVLRLSWDPFISVLILENAQEECKFHVR